MLTLNSTLKKTCQIKPRGEYYLSVHACVLKVKDTLQNTQGKQEQPSFMQEIQSDNDDKYVAECILFLQLIHRVLQYSKQYILIGFFYHLLGFLLVW